MESGLHRTRKALDGSGEQHMSPTLLAAGYINIDVVAVVDSLPEFGGRVTARSISRSPGGMTANMACAAARLGLRTRLFGSVGCDAEGAHALNELQRFGVDTDDVVRTDSATTTALVLLTPGGERAIVSEPMLFHYGPLEAALESLEDKERACLHVDGYRLPEALHILNKARSAGICISSDLDGIEARELEESIEQIAASLDAVFLNRRLAQAIAPTPQSAAERLLDLGVGTAAITLGNEGVLVAEQQQIALLHPPPTEVRDTTGAGDVFAGAFLAAWLEGGDAGQAGRFAVAASAISVSGEGARGHLPDRKEVERVLDLVEMKETKERSYSSD